MQFQDLLPRRQSVVVVLVAGLAATACSGNVGKSPSDEPGGGQGGGEGGQGGETVEPGPDPVAAECSARMGRPAWQLSTKTAFQIHTIVGQVFGADAVKDPQVASMVTNLPANLQEKGFDTENKAIASQFTDSYIALAGRLAGLAAEQPTMRGAIEAFSGKTCAKTLDLDAGCGLELARAFANAIEQEPLSDDDFNFIIDAYKSNKTKYSPAKAYGGFIASVLMSAKSALRYDSAELSKTGTVDARTLAARLALLLTSGLPDADLRGKIEDRSILKANVIKSESKRLMRTTAGRQTLRRFVDQWLNLALLKTPPAATGYVASVAESALVGTAARDEIGKLFEAAVLDKGGSLADFMNTNEVVPSHDWLAKVYGTGKGGNAIAATAADRRGILTRVAFALFGDYGDYLPIAHRGNMVNATMLCGDIPPPPKVDTTLPPNTPDAMSSRQYFEILTEQPKCIGCHAYMNPYGYAMSGFSVTGARLTKETVKNIKTMQLVQVDTKEAATVKLDTGTKDVSDASALSEAVGNSDQARACFSHRFDQFAVGVKEEFVCSGDGAKPAPKNDLTLEDTILSYVVSSAFSAR